MRYMFSLVDLEVTKGCNLSCDFCPTNKYDPMYFMNNDYILDHVLQRIAEFQRDSNKYLRVCISGRGEPSLNPNLVPIIYRLVQQKKVRVLLMTNGAKLSEKWIQDVFAAGLHGMHIDCYNDWTWRKANELQYPVYVNAMEDANMWTNPNKGVVILDERSILNPNRNMALRHYKNWAGALSIDKFHPAWRGDVPRRSPCAALLRMITIRFDGVYSYCCHRWKDYETLGDVQTLSFKETYDHKARMDTAYKLAFTDGRQGISECGVCTHIDQRAHVFKAALKDRGYEV